MAKGRTGDGRIIVPRPPAGTRPAGEGRTARELAARAFEIQLLSNRRLRANRVYQAFMVALTIGLMLVGFPLLDAWLFSRGSLDWRDFAFTAAFIATPYVGIGTALAVGLLRRRA